MIVGSLKIKTVINTSVILSTEKQKTGEYRYAVLRFIVSVKTIIIAGL